MTARKIQILIVGPEQRQHDPPGYLPRRGTVDGRGLAQLGRDTLQAGQQQDDPEADELPGDHEEQRVEHQRGAGQPEVDQGGQAGRLEQAIHGPAVRQQHRPHHRARGLGQYVRREHGKPQGRLPAHPAVEQQGQPDADRELDDDGQYRDDDVVQQGLVEHGTCHDTLVVLQADEVAQRPVAVPVVQAAPDGEDHRDEHEPDEQDQGRTEQDGQLDPLTPRAALLRRGTGGGGRRISGPAASLAAPRSRVLSARAISGRSWNSRS